MMLLTILHYDAVGVFEALLRRLCVYVCVCVTLPQPCGSPRHSTPGATKVRLLSHDVSLPSSPPAERWAGLQPPQTDGHFHFLQMIFLGTLTLPNVGT